MVFPEEREAGECLPLHRCCHLARIWRERHQRQVEEEGEGQDKSSGPLSAYFPVLATLSEPLSLRQGGVQLASEILENSRCGFRGHQSLYR